MSSLAIQRLETLLQTRKLDNTLAQQLPAGGVLPTGIEGLDVRLGGGWPQGEVSEITGRPSSGCTGVLVASLAAATRRGALVGLVDAFDRFDPPMAVRAGVDLARVLWVRGPALMMTGRRRQGLGGGPRGIPDVLDRAVLNAVRALDLIVRAGGFAVAALDLSDAPAHAIAALPFTTWLRLAHANEGRDTVCLLVGRASMGRSARGRSVRLDARRCWSGAHPQSRRFIGFEPSVDVSSASAPRTAARA